MISIRRPRTGIDALDRALDDLVSSLGPLLRIPEARAVEVNVTLALGANTIYHGLGRLPVGWYATDVFDSGTTTPTMHRQAWNLETAAIYVSGAACTARLRFY